MWGCHGPDHMVVGYTAICVRLAAGLWFPLGTPVPSTNKTGCHDITEILLKMREKWHNRLMTFNSPWKNMESWIEVTTLLFCSTITVLTLFQNLGNSN